MHTLVQADPAGSHLHGVRGDQGGLTWTSVQRGVGVNPKGVPTRGMQSADSRRRTRRVRGEGGPRPLEKRGIAHQPQLEPFIQVRLHNVVKQADRKILK